MTTVPSILTLLTAIVVVAMTTVPSILHSYLSDSHCCGRHVQNEAVAIFPWSG
jgi:hypothetical protein